MEMITASGGPLQKFNSTWIAACLMSSILGCSNQGPAPGGYLTRNGDGGVAKVPEVGSEAYCATHFCEPNQPVTVDPGKPDPVLPGGPSLVGEYLDYSKQIVHATEAWQTTTGSRDIVVAVLDSGIDFSHPDLHANAWNNPAELHGISGVDDDGDGLIDDLHGWDFVDNRPEGLSENPHGTHCAGIIGATLNGIGTAGLSPKVSLMSLRYLDGNGNGYTYQAIQGIDYAIAHHANVLSLSWGSGTYSALLEEAILRATAHGMLVVAAAGNIARNTDITPWYPSGYAGVISVGNSDETDQLNSGSAWGLQSVFINAPGTHIYSTVLNHGWASFTGTSMAAPQVAGALALALSVNPRLTAEDLRARLCQSADPVLLNKVKCGRLNVERLIAQVADTASALSSTAFPQNPVR